MILATPTTADDFCDLKIIQNGAYSKTDLKHDTLNMFRMCKEILTFRNKYGILGIMGYRKVGLVSEIFAYIGEPFRQTLCKEYIKYLRDMVKCIKETSQSSALITYVQADHDVACKFIKSLNFRETGLRKFRNNNYKVFELCQE